MINNNQYREERKKDRQAGRHKTDREKGRPAGRPASRPGRQTGRETDTQRKRQRNHNQAQRHRAPSLKKNKRAFSQDGKNPLASWLRRQAIYPPMLEVLDSIPRGIIS